MVLAPDASPSTLQRLVEERHGLVELARRPGTHWPGCSCCRACRGGRGRASPSADFQRLLEERLGLGRTRPAARYAAARLFMAGERVGVVGAELRAADFSRVSSSSALGLGIAARLSQQTPARLLRESSVAGSSGPSSCCRSSTARRRCRSACSYFARFRQVLPMASRAVASASGRPANRSSRCRLGRLQRLGPPSRRLPGRLARLPVGRPRARRRPGSR